MAWYRDLDPCDYFGSVFAAQPKAVGWLERDKPFNTGPVSEQVFEKLCRLLANPWNPVSTFGIHTCDLCQFTGEGTAHFRDQRVSACSSTCLFIPGEGFFYIAPSSIAHYIDAHWYQPLREFSNAVLNCPEMRSVKYLKAILANGGREVVNRSKSE